MSTNEDLTQPLVRGSFRYKQEDPDYKGSNVNYELQNGPVESRPCRDILCAILFIAMIGGMVYIGILAFQQGDPSLLASPFDSSGHQCKLDKKDPSYANYPFIFVDYLTSNQIIYVCVKNCPINNTSPIQCKTMPDILPSCDLLTPYQTQQLVNICLPPFNASDTASQIQKYLHISTLTKGFSDLKSTWPVILGSVGIAIGICIILSILIRFLAGCMVWTIITSLYVILLVAGTFCFLLRNTDWVRQMAEYQRFPDTLKDQDVLLGIAITCWVLCFLFILATCCYYKQIRISVGIMKATADYVRQQCSSYFIFFYIVLLQAGFLAIWIVIMLYLFSSGEVKQLDSTTPFAWVEWNQNQRYFTIYYLFGLIWILSYFSALGKFLMSSTAAIWYFEEGNPTAPLAKSFCRSIKVFGSLAFGSLLLTFILIIRLFLQIIHKYAKQSTMPDQKTKKAIQCCVKCLSCCVACFERLIRFITDNAYIMMAISGKGFCSSASEAFYLMLRCTSQFFVTNGTVFLFRWFGKIFITFTTTFICFLIITQTSEYRHKIYSALFPSIMFFIVAYPIASTFMEFYAMSAKTLLMCYCVEKDLAVRKGNCPPALRNFFEDYIQDSQLSQAQ